MRTLLAVALAVLWPGSAAALDWYEAKLPRGPGDPWPYLVDGRKAKPAGIDKATVQATIAKAFKAWEDVDCAYVSFRSEGFDTTRGARQGDGANVIGTFIEARSEDPELYDTFLQDGLVISVAMPLHYGGTIYECDVAFNAVDFAWGTSGDLLKADLQTAATHEIGHCLGLSHTSDEGSAMYLVTGPGYVTRTLSSTDRANLCGVYPQTGAVGSPCVAGQCPNGLSCVTSGASAFCSQGCDPAQPNACPIGFSCLTPSRIPGQPGSCEFGGAGSILVGKACDTGSVAADCGAPADALCIAPDPLNAGIWKDGYCSSDCSAHPCPTGSSCEALVDPIFGAVQRCLKDCRVDTADCRRPDYACVPRDDRPGMGRCKPSCVKAGCAQGTCRSCDGLCVATGGTKLVGEPCDADSECRAGTVCRRDLGFGICTRSCGGLCAQCDQGSHCMLHGHELLCTLACETGDDCPNPFGCWEEGGVKGCKSPCGNTDDCPNGTACYNGSCLRPAGEDAGCALCSPRDAGPVRPDASVSPAGDAWLTPAPYGSCGCGAGAAPALLALGALGALLWRKRCRA